MLKLKHFYYIDKDFCLTFFSDYNKQPINNRLIKYGMFLY